LRDTCAVRLLKSGEPIETVLKKLDTVGELKKREYNQRRQGKRTFHKRSKMIVSMLLDRERRERIEHQ